MPTKKFSDEQIAFALRQADSGTAIYRLYSEEGLSIRTRSPRRRRACRYRAGRAAAAGVNDVWAMDFMSDRLFDGRAFRILTVVDCHTREALSTALRERRWGRHATRAPEVLLLTFSVKPGGGGPHPDFGPRKANKPIEFLDDVAGAEVRSRCLILAQDLCGVKCGVGVLEEAVSLNIISALAPFCWWNSGDLGDVVGRHPSAYDRLPGVDTGESGKSRMAAWA